MLQYWGTCIDLESEGSPYDPTEFAQIDEQAERVIPEFFNEKVYVDVHSFLTTRNIVDSECGLYPDSQNPKCGFIYDRDEDIHYIFVF